MVATELQKLQRVAKSLGVKATGSRDDLLRRLTKVLGITKAQLLEQIHEASSKKHKKHKRRVGAYTNGAYGAYADEPSDNDLILSYCGPQCFADKKAKHRICPKCDSEKCYCYPECTAIRDAYIKGLDRERMQAYAEALDCPGWPTTLQKPRRNAAAPPVGADSAFDVDDLLVALVKDKGHTYPIFGMVKQVKDVDGVIEIKMLRHDDFEITDFLAQAFEMGIEFTAEDLSSVEDNFAIVPKAKFADAKPLIKTNLEGYWKSHRVYFDFYDENKLYLRHYSINDIRKVMQRLQRLRRSVH